MVAKNRDEAKRELMAECNGRIPDNVIDLLLDIHEKDPEYFHKQMRDILREEKKGPCRKSGHAEKLQSLIPAIEVENVELGGPIIEEIEVVE
jgi:hypothetical protein